MESKFLVLFVYCMLTLGPCATYFRKTLFFLSLEEAKVH